jgi:hypothetical protein
MVEIIPPVLTEYLRHFYDEFEFNSCLVEMVRYRKYLSDERVVTSLLY